MELLFFAAMPLLMLAIVAAPAGAIAYGVLRLIPAGERAADYRPAAAAVLLSAAVVWVALWLAVEAGVLAGWL